jgi:hypothetical protein
VKKARVICFGGCHWCERDIDNMDLYYIYYADQVEIDYLCNECIYPAPNGGLEKLSEEDRKEAEEYIFVRIISNSFSNIKHLKFDEMMKLFTRTYNEHCIKEIIE